MNVNQLILRIGTDTEVQMDIALTGHADLSQYQPRQVSPNTRVAYGPMFWTLTTASIQLSDDGKQADKGMRFIVVTLKIENPSTQDLHTYPPDYVRLQAGGGTIAPEGGCPGNFFTSRKWSFEQGSLVIRDHLGTPLATLAHASPGRFEGKATGGLQMTLGR